jgi:predicted nuclease of predicted toxin-antitoxin system
VRFLFDQSTDRRLVPYLRDLGHDVTVVAVDYPEGLSDPEVLSIATTERRIVVTEDRDFGELVFRLRQAHTGVLYLRLPPMELTDKLLRLREVLSRYPEEINDFIVVTASRIRARGTS